MKILVLGGTGTVGSAVVRGLMEAGHHPRVLTRSSRRQADLPDGVDGVVGDLTDPNTLGGVFDGVDRLFLLNGVTATELQEGLVALNEARRADVQRIVYLSVHDAARAPHVPHFASKVAIEAAVKASGVAYTILRPNNFFQNDAWYREAMVTYGIYPQPIGSAGLSRVDTRDVAEASVRALTLDGHEGQTYTLAGPQTLTGSDCARIWATALGRDVQYAGDDLDAWSAQVASMLPAWMIYDLRMMYAFFQNDGLAATHAQRSETQTLLGRDPRPLDAYARDTAPRWTSTNRPVNVGK